MDLCRLDLRCALGRHLTNSLQYTSAEQSSAIFQEPHPCHQRIRLFRIPSVLFSPSIIPPSLHSGQFASVSPLPGRRPVPFCNAPSPLTAVPFSLPFQPSTSKHPYQSKDTHSAGFAHIIDGSWHSLAAAAPSFISLPNGSSPSAIRLPKTQNAALLPSPLLVSALLCAVLTLTYFPCLALPCLALPLFLSFSLSLPVYSLPTPPYQ